MMRVLRFECMHSGKVTVSQHQMYVLGFVVCQCGKAFKIRPNKTGEVTIPPHNDPRLKKQQAIRDSIERDIIEGRT